MPTYKLTYFDGRGSAEISRLVFKVAGIEFEDERLAGEAWQKRKPETPLEKMPILQIDGKEGKKTYSQSSAIARYLAKTFGLMGANNEEELRIDEVMEVFTEMRERELFKVYQAKDNPETQKELMKKFTDEPMKKYMNFLERVLKENSDKNGFLVGSKLSLGDLVIFDGLEFMKEVFKIDPFEGRKLLKDHYDKVAADTKVADWIKKRPKSTF